MNRLTLIKIHLYLSGVILVFLGMMALSGSLHLLIGSEDESVSTVKMIEVSKDLSKDNLTSLFKSELKSIDSNYDFDYIKGSSSSQISRPTTREYYSIKIKDGMAQIDKHSPSSLKSLMELHKGHGPRSSRNILGVLGLIVIGAILSGLWLGWSSKVFRKITISTLFSGLFIYIALFFL